MTLTKEELAARWPGKFEGYEPLPDYFPERPWGCKCHTCKRTGFVMTELITMLNMARHFAGVPFVITSAMRCEAYNFYLGGSKDSSHISGVAADIEVKDSRSRYKILNGVFLAGFMRIGIHIDFIHVDIDGFKDRSVAWVS